MYASIVVGTDGSSTSRAAVDHAVALARATGAALHLVHAYRLPSSAAVAAPELAGVLATTDGDATEAARLMVQGVVESIERDGCRR